MMLLRFRVQPFRAISIAAPGVHQLDNSSELLSKVPHRKHPGILRLKMVHLPLEAQNAAKYLLERSSVRQLEEQVASLNNYLWSRKRPAEERELRERALQLENKFKESMKYEPDSNIDKQEQKLKDAVLRSLRKNTYHWEPLNYTEHFGLLYLAARFDGEFAAVYRALHEICRRVPEFRPQTLMDFGAGVGSVSWAAHAIWNNSLKEYMCIDTSAPMNRIGELIMRGGLEKGDMHISGVHFRQYLPVSPKVQYDLVISAYSLNELPNRSEREKIIRTLWRKTGGFLVLVENGTREGHQLLMEARNIVLRGGDKEVWDHRPACVFAPCPHHLECPKLAESHQVPCNFLQQYEPLPLRWNPPQRSEKFSFLIISRGLMGENDHHWPRVLAPVLCRARHVHCLMCSSDGSLHHEVITARKHGRDLYRCAKNCKWGDRLPAMLSDVTSDCAEPEVEEKIPVL